MSALDVNLSWGECSLEPDLVEREIKRSPWKEETKVRYGLERLSLEEGDDESIFDVNGAPIPMRGMIVKVMLHHSGERKPWKMWLKTDISSGWLVVTDSGWKFFPQKTKTA